VQSNSSEVVAASVVYLNKVRMDRGMAQPEWNNTHALRHFSIVRKLDGRPFPPGKSSLHLLLTILIYERWEEVAQEV